MPSWRTPVPRVSRVRAATVIVVRAAAAAIVVAADGGGDPAVVTASRAAAAAAIVARVAMAAVARGGSWPASRAHGGNDDGPAPEFAPAFLTGDRD